MSRSLAQPVVRGAVLGLCPRCGKRTLFHRIVVFRDRCESCELDYASFDVGDAAAPFLIIIVGTIVMIGAVWLELSRSPPWWVHALLWLPLSLGLTLGLLRVAKGILLSLEYKTDARLGRPE